MSVSPPPKVLIVASDATAGQRWADSLRAAGIRVWCNLAEAPPDIVIDLLVTDRPAVEALSAVGSTGHEATSVEHDSSALDELAPLGIVAIGNSEVASPEANVDATSRVADAQLPADVTPRELVLACRLVGVIVRLRRQHDRHATLHQKMTRLAMSDSLTGLPNRRAWDERLAADVDAATATRGGLCLVLMDLDHFKRVNDTRGHATGDAVLRAAAEALRAELRRDDFVARLGGDEFGALMPGLRAAQANPVVERIRAAVSTRLAESAGGPVTVSAGFALCGKAITSGDALYSTADAALHAAKRAGRNCSRSAS